MDRSSKIPILAIYIDSFINKEPYKFQCEIWIPILRCFLNQIMENIPSENIFLINISTFLNEINSFFHCNFIIESANRIDKMMNDTLSLIIGLIDIDTLLD